MSSGLTCTDLYKVQDCENQAREDQTVQVTDNREDSEDNSGEDSEEEDQKTAATIGNHNDVPRISRPSPETEGEVLGTRLGKRQPKVLFNY